MQDHGLTVLRFWNSEVAGSLEGVLEVIHHAMVGE
jgi:very-short-patch-repair endonuclease